MSKNLFDPADLPTVGQTVTVRLYPHPFTSFEGVVATVINEPIPCVGVNYAGFEMEMFTPNTRYDLTSDTAFTRCTCDLRTYPHLRTLDCDWGDRKPRLWYLSAFLDY